MNPTGTSITLALTLLAAAPAAAQDKAKVDFQKQIWPILEKNCVECHRETHVDENGRRRRPKGKVQLDSRAAIEASKGGKLFVAKKPDESLVYESISLPADDEDRMPPPKEGGPLPKEQVELIKLWIEQGADFGKWTGAAKPEPKQDAETDSPAKTGGRTPTPKKKGPAPLVTLSKGLSPLPEATLLKLADTPFRAESVGDGNPLLRVSCAGRTDEVDDRALVALVPLQEHVTELDLARTRVGDAGCAILARMPRLTALDLRQSQVGDKGVAALAPLRELRTLNLFGTSVGDYAMAALEGMKNLEQLYIWQTDVTAKAAVKLRETLPGLRVVFAADLPEPSEDADGTPRRRR